MKAYAALLSSRIRALLQYRVAAIAGAGTQLFFGIVRMMIFEAFYASSAAAQPMTAEQVTTYVWLGQAMFILTMIAVDSDVALMIRTGNVAYELTRPLDLYTLWLVRAFSGRAVPLLLRSIPIVIVAGLFFGLQPPVSAAAGLLFAISVLLGAILAASLIALITISMLWTISGEGISRLAPAAIFFFSGIVVPLPLFPDWIQSALDLMPFGGLIDTPMRIYMGHIGLAEAGPAMARQLIWIAALVSAGRAVLARGLRRLVVQGG